MGSLADLQETEELAFQLWAEHCTPYLFISWAEQAARKSSAEFYLCCSKLAA